MPGTTHPYRTALLVGLVSAAIAGGSLTWSILTQPVMVLGPMVQQVGPDSFALFCSTSNAEQIAAELRGPDGFESAGTVSPQARGRFIITFSGLQPATLYEYEILTHRGVRLAQHPVRTAPTDGRAFRFVALGDTGVGDRHQNRVARRMREARPDLIIHTGDLIYPKGRLEDHHRKFFQPYAELLATVPLYACMGNHECRLPDVERVPESFVLPPNGPAGVPPGRNYWFDWGCARFIAIDSNNDQPFFAETIVPWLEQVMPSAGDRWKILFFHEPVHTQAKYPPAEKLLSTIVPVLEAHGAHLVLCGHNHLYERSHPVRDGRVVPQGQGTVYVTTGAGGANLAEVQLPMPETLAAWEDREHSLTLVDVTPRMLSLRQIGATGRLIDEYHIPRE